MDISAKQLNDIREAYAIGRHKPIKEITEKDFDLTVDDAEKAGIGPVEQKVLLRCGRSRTAALKASRQRQYGIAEYLFAATDKLLQAETFSPAGRLVAQSAHESAVAYLDYRYERFEIGTERIYRALACDETLEEVYELTSYHGHRIRLLLNLVRLKRRQGEVIEALRMSLALIDYLEQKVPSLPFPTTWDARRLDNLPLSLKDFLFEQAIYEMMFLVVGQQCSSADVVSALSEHIYAGSSPHCQLSPRAHRWLQARHALHIQQPGRFLDLVLPLVAAGPEGAVWLWYGIAIDLVILCRDLSLEAAHLLLQTIAEDMPSWRWSSLPPSWKQISQTIAVRIHA